MCKTFPRSHSDFECFSPFFSDILRFKKIMLRKEPTDFFLFSHESDEITHILSNGRLRIIPRFDKYSLSKRGMMHVNFHGYHIKTTLYYTVLSDFGGFHDCGVHPSWHVILRSACAQLARTCRLNHRAQP